MQDRTRLAGYAGLAFFVSVVVNVVAGGSPPAFDASGEEIREYLIDNRSGILVAGVAQVVALVFFPWFVLGLRDVVGRARDGRLLGDVVLFAGIAAAASVLVGQALVGSLVWIDGLAEELGDDTARVVWSASTLVFIGGAPLVALLAGATALAGFRSRVVPMLVAWVGVLVAAASVVGFIGQLGADVGGFGFGFFVGLVLFTLVTAVAMAAGRMTAAAGATAGAVE